MIADEPTPTVREALHQQAALAHWEPRALEEALALLEGLPAAHHWKLFGALVAVEESETARMLDEEVRVLAALAGHFPGLAPALVVAWEHIRETTGFCPGGAACEVYQRLRPRASESA